MEPQTQLLLRRGITPPQLIDLFDQIKTSTNTVKVGVKELSLFTDQRSMDTIVAIVRDALHASDEDQAMVLWNKCKKNLQNRVIVGIETSLDEASVDLELFKKLKLDGHFVTKAALAYYSYAKPKDTPYARHFGDLNEETAETLVLVIRQLPLAEAKEGIIRLGMPALYKLLSSEISPEDGYETEAFSGARTGLMISDDLPLAAWLQENMPDLFALVMGEVANPDWEDLRKMFYEVYYRTVNGKQHKKEYGDDEDDFINSELKD